MRLSRMLLAVSALLLANVAPAAAFSASFRWCSGTPSFTLSGVPMGTTRLEFEMTDLNKPSFNHGGGAIAYSGQRSIGCGAFGGDRYVGPSPPPPEIHTYEIELKAKDAAGKVLGTVKARRKFPE